MRVWTTPCTLPTDWSTFSAVDLSASKLGLGLAGDGHQLADLGLARFQGADEVFQHLFGADLAEQVSQALFGEGADFLDGLAPGLGADDAQIALVLAALGRLLAGAVAGKQAGAGLAAVQRHTSGVGHGPAEGVENQLGGFVGQ